MTFSGNNYFLRVQIKGGTCILDLTNNKSGKVGGAMKKGCSNVLFVLLGLSTVTKFTRMLGG